MPHMAINVLTINPRHDMTLRHNTDLTPRHLIVLSKRRQRIWILILQRVSIFWTLGKSSGKHYNWYSLRVMTTRQNR